MPTKLFVIRAKDFLTVTASGTLDFEQSKKMLMDVAKAAGSLAEYEIILDTRTAESDLSTTDLWYLACEMGKLGSAFGHKTAVLCPQERFDAAEFFSLCAQNRGLQVQGFTSFEDAMEWLTEKAEHIPAGP